MFRALLRRLRRGGDGSVADEAADADDRAAGTDGVDEPAAAGDDAARAGDTDDDRYFWDLVPSWQYDGRHVESGGQTTKEQEAALQDVQRQAAAIEAREGVDAPAHPDDQ